MTKASDNVFPRFLISEGGSTATPAANRVTLYAKADGLLYSKDDAGAETLVSGGAGGGSVATDAIWDAAGDLAIGTGANTAAKLTVGASGKVPTSNGTTLAYAFPPGYEFDYAEITSPVAIASTSEGSPTTIISGNAVSYDGSTIVVIEFFAPFIDSDTTGTIDIVTLWDGSTDLGRIAQIRADVGGGADRRIPVYARRRLTPSNASHTYHIKAWKTAASSPSVEAGSGGAGSILPAFLRITKV